MVWRTLSRALVHSNRKSTPSHRRPLGARPSPSSLCPPPPSADRHFQSVSPGLVSVMLRGLGPVAQALLGTVFTWAVTALGAAVVFLAPSHSVRRTSPAAPPGRALGLPWRQARGCPPGLGAEPCRVSWSHAVRVRGPSLLL